MRMEKQSISDGNSIYRLFGSSDRMPLVTVEDIDGNPSITAVQSRNGLTVSEAADYAKALMMGVKIVEALKNGTVIPHFEE